MHETYLGRTGLVVSELCLGTMTLGGDGADIQTSRAIVERFRDEGGTFFDTADVYQDGESERVLGELLGKERDEVVIATKAYGATGEGPNARSASRRHLLSAVDASLERLGTDWIDLFQLHRFDPTTPLEETLSTLEDLVRAGKILHVGVSNFLGWQLERAVRLQEAAGFDRFVSLQPQHSLAERQIELEVLPAAHANGMAILPWSPLAGGFLTGKYARGEDASGKGRFARWVDDMPEQGWDTLDVLRTTAQEHGTEPATVAIAWLLGQPATIPIVGATSPEQLDASLAATSLELSEGGRARLDEVSAPRQGYPWHFPPQDGRPPRDVMA